MFDKILLGTLIKEINKSKISGKLCILELYLLSIINDFLECNNLTECQTNKLNDLYNGIINSNPYICKYRKKPKHHFFKYKNDKLNNYFKEMANFNININEQINQPPVVVGDGASTTNHATTYIFSRADFTSNTVPAYLDPEGDPAGLLKILTLPSGGTIKLNGVDVIANQVIDFADIDSNLLVYEPDPLTTTARVENFTFAVADTGSLTFIQ